MDKKEFKGSGVFFTGKGVVSHRGADYRTGKELPADLPKETLEALLKKGKVSTTRPMGGVVAVAAADKRVTELESKLSEVTAAATRNCEEIEKRGARIAELEKTSTEREELIADLRAQLEANRVTIEQLTAQLTGAAPAAPAPEAPAAEAPKAPSGAGPKK
jgi:uncharacterized coiled-coil protein SlyX